MVICPSEFAASELRALFGVRRIRVVPNGVCASRGNARPLSVAELAQIGLRTRLVVHAGGATVRKNLATLAGAWEEVVADDPTAYLALCGPPDARRDDLFRGLRNVRYLGYRPVDFLARLVRSAAVVAIPSLYEGFGLPALEAMAAGVPVVAAATGALPEVCGNAALLVPPTASAFAAAIRSVLVGGATIDGLRLAGRGRAAAYSWERTARETAAVYEEVFG
jgi:glycosyltransferase involved in cell wall biosynthesis